MVLSLCYSACLRFLLPLSLTFAVAPPDIVAAGRLVINEVMVNEPGSETSLEWIELLNAGDDSLNLKNYLFIEATDTTRFATGWLRANSFVVLSRKPLSTDGTASFERHWGNASNAWGDDSFENYLLLPAKMSLRNSHDSVTIVDLGIGQSETVAWDNSPPDGVSIERVNPFAGAQGKNFKYCRSKLLCTPGATNSVIAKQRDLGFIEDDCEIFTPSSIDQPLLLRLALANLGLSVAPAFPLTVIDDRNFNGSFDGVDSSIWFPIAPLLVDSELVLEINLPVKPGRRALNVMLPDDDDSTNNQIDFECVVGPRSEELQVTEIMNNADFAHGGEWIEVAGIVDYALLLQAWKLDIDGSAVELDSAATVLPYARSIICQDTSALRRAFPELGCPILQPRSWHSLGNSMGTIILRTALGAISDSVTYFGSEPDRSWERDPDSTSQSFTTSFYMSTDSLGSTPCQVNSPRPVPIGNDLGVLSGSLALRHNLSSSNLVDVSLRVVNFGYRDAGPTRIDVFEDSNRDSTRHPNELIHSTMTLAVLSGDTTTVTLSLDLVAGRHLLTFLLPDDEDSSNNLALGCITSGSRTGELVITELLIDPVSPLESEWIEIRNTTNFPVALSGWTIGDIGRQSLLRPDVVMAPGEYRVVVQDSAAYCRFYGGECIPISAVNWNSLNNGGDGIILRDEYGTLSDSMSYSRGAGDNRSLEKNEAGTPGIPGWFASPITGGPSPCGTNDLPQPLPAYDLGFVDGGVMLRKDATNQAQVLCTLGVANNGYLETASARIVFFDDRNLDGVGSGEEVLANLTTPALQPGDTGVVAVVFTLSTGRHELIFELSDDDVLSNNQAIESTTVGPITHELVITEILADPELPVATEWIEIYNRSASPRSLTGWSLGDGTHRRLINSELLVNPGAYGILVSDRVAFVHSYGDGCNLCELSSWPGLSNSGDIVVLCDEFGTVSDSVRYTSCVGGNRSLECNESDSSGSWYPSTAARGATPCVRNSVSNGYAGTFSIDLLNRVFAPAAGEQLRIAIQCPPATRFTIEIFDLEGRRQRTIAESQLYSSGEFIYDGRSDYYDHLPMGAYILKIESEDGAFAGKLGFAVAAPR